MSDAPQSVVRLKSDGTWEEPSVDEVMRTVVYLFTRRMVDAMFDGVPRDDGSYVTPPQSLRPNESQRESLALQLTAEILPGLRCDLDERWNYAMRAATRGHSAVLRRLYPRWAQGFMELAEEREGIRGESG